MGIWSNIKKANPYAQINHLKKQIQKMLPGIGLRPASADSYTGDYHVVPQYRWPLYSLYDVSYNSDVLTTIHNALRREIFRNGYEVTPAAEMTAEITSSEEEVDVDEDKIEDERKNILAFLESCNKNKQSIVDVYMEIEDDFSIIDEGFLVFVFEYEIENGELSKKILREILRGDPRNMGKVMNKWDEYGTDDEGRTLYVYPSDRTRTHPDKEYSSSGERGYPAHYFYTDGTSKYYYYEWEVEHENKYRPSRRSGFPPVLTVWQKARTLFNQDNYLMESFEPGGRPPKKMLIAKTANQDSLRASWEEGAEKARENPHWPMLFAIQGQPNDQSRKFAEVIDFINTPEELQMTEMRNEYYRKIGAVYGVMPIWQADISTSGGLNNEGMQVTVSNRTVEYGQSIYNNKFSPKVMEAMNKKGWSFVLNPSEEQDEAAKLDRVQKSLQNAKLAAELGLKAEWNEDTMDVNISDGEVQKPDNPMGFGGIPKPEQQPDLTSGAPEKPTTSKRVKKKRAPFTQIKQAIQKEIDEFTRKFKKKPTTQELEAIITEVNNRLTSEIKSSVESHFNEIYQEEAKNTGQNLGINNTFDIVDQQAIDVLKNQDVLSKAFTGISQVMTSKMRKIIEDSFETPGGLDPKVMTEKLKDVAELADSRAENIARTESGKVAAAARRNQYKKADPEGNFIYKWIGPNDNRTTDTSKRIKRRVGNGVPWEQLVKIVEEESSKDYPDWTVDKEFPVSHYQSRHTFVRAV